ncbi:MAG: hypothetical protein COU34_03775 [Candidatus Magasanikbacteria bacterium CG10_big_fil_rev_8_21_14_0_10_43_9]|nr:MAG: hypothetical protein COU34_03775 [Candidatus Magasanikbacteria bacterium CG10_big_fil_rev_8_21_14_0_10_43_9]
MSKFVSFFVALTLTLTAACGPQETSQHPQQEVGEQNKLATQIRCEQVSPAQETLPRALRFICKDIDLQVCWYRDGASRTGVGFSIPCEKFDEWVKK